jgi:hypothetical protein
VMIAKWTFNVVLGVESRFKLMKQASSSLHDLGNIVPWDEMTFVGMASFSST